LKEALSTLKEYQVVLTQIAQLEKQLAHIPPEIQELESEWKALTDKIETHRGEIEKTKEETHKSDLDLTVQREKLQKFEGDLSEVTNDKEYNAVLREIDTAKKEIGRLEGKIKEGNASIGELEKAIDETEALAKESEKRYKDELKSYRDGQSSGSGELENLIAERDKAVDKVPKGLLSKFNRIAERREGVGLAFCQDSICKSCNVRVRHHIVEQLKTHDKVLQCESCRRILYYQEPEA